MLKNDPADDLRLVVYDPKQKPKNKAH